MLHSSVCAPAFFNLSVRACSKQPSSCARQGHGEGLGVAMATVELLDLLAHVSDLADHRGSRVTADYLQKERGYRSSKRAETFSCERRLPLMYSLMALAQPNHSPCYLTLYFSAAAQNNTEKKLLSQAHYELFGPRTSKTLTNF